MTSTTHPRPAALAVLILLLGACATRVTRPPREGAALHPDSAAAATERVDVVLASEPPLPGDALGPWSPLEPASAPAPAPAPAAPGHHHHAPAGGAR